MATKIATTTKPAKPSKPSKPRLNRKRHDVLPDEWSHQDSTRYKDEIPPEELIRLRLKHHLSQDQVAMLCRVRQNTVNHWELGFVGGKRGPRMPLPYWELLKARLGYPFKFASEVFVENGLPPEGEASMLRKTKNLVAAGADELLPPINGMLMPILTAKEAERQLALKREGKWKAKHIPMRYRGRLPDDARRIEPMPATKKAAGKMAPLKSASKKTPTRKKTKP